MPDGGYIPYRDYIDNHRQEENLNIAYGHGSDGCGRFSGGTPAW